MARQRSDPRSDTGSGTIASARAIAATIFLHAQIILPSNNVQALELVEERHCVWFHCRRFVLIPNVDEMASGPCRYNFGPLLIPDFRFYRIVRSCRHPHGYWFVERHVEGTQTAREGYEQKGLRTKPQKNAVYETCRHTTCHEHSRKNIGSSSSE